MTVSDPSREAWRNAFGEALGPLSGTLTAHRQGLPDLGNAEYQELAKRGRVDVKARAVLDDYLTEIHADPSKVIELVVKHPGVGAVFGGQGKDTATFVTMPGKGFRVELKQLAQRAATDRRKTGRRGSSGGNGQIPDAWYGRTFARLQCCGNSRTGDERRG